MKYLKNDFYFHLYGRHKGVTGSCFLGSIHFPDKSNVRFLVDCGNFQGKDNDGYINLNDVIPFDTQKIDFVLITHNHIDHIGLLPLLIQQGYTGPVYMTKPGLGLVDIPINEAWKLNCKGKTNPSYDENDINLLFKKMVGISYNKKISPKKNVEITFFENGHIVGSSLIEVKFSYPGRDDIKILFTGDYHYKNIFFDVNKIPLQNRKVPYSLVVCESTYGDMDSTDDCFKPILVDTIKKAIDNQMKVIIPTFAMGRTQEILYIIKHMQDTKILSGDIEIWQGGTSAREITNRYRYNNLGLKPHMKNFLPKNFNFIPSKEKKSICDKLLQTSRPSIIISPSGMASYGAVRPFISKAISKDDVLIMFSGHCSTDSKGYELLNTTKGSEVNYDNFSQIRNCEIAISGEISAHAKRDELLLFLKDMYEPKSILVNHGENDVKLQFANYLKNNFSSRTRIEVFEPDYGYAVNSNGIYEVFPSTFQLF